MNFASDNSGPAAPEILEAIISANKGYQNSYGGDSLMEKIKNQLREIFEAPDAAIYLVATGTAANALSLACLCPSWSTIFCHEHSHIQEDECGAPEFFTGGSKLTTVEGKHAKIDPQQLAKAISSTGIIGVHNVQKGALSITNATELGAVYDLDEIIELTSMAKDFDLPVHMDGARFANALVKLGCSPAELSWKSGVDILSFGGTKNGLLGVEAVIIFDPSLAWEFELRRKRGGHLFSKHRFLSAQMKAYLKDDLWLQLAQKANSAAAKLSRELTNQETVKIEHPTDANMVFPSLPREIHNLAFSKKAAYYLWPPNQSLEGNPKETLKARMVCNWSTTDEEIETFVNLVKSCQV